MGNQWGLGLHFIFVTIFLVATINICLGAQNTTVDCVEHERLALLKFKHSVSGDYYDMLASWVGNDCCHWERVVCDGVTGNVVSLHLGYAALFSDGELSTSLGELRHLKYLDLSRNDFQDSKGIPEFIGNLKQLTYLNLSDSCFPVNIPNHIGNLSNLKILDLHSHSCPSLEAHDMAWISGLSSLEHLDLSGVNLSEAKNLDMVFYMIPSLKVLGLSSCGISNANFGLLRNSSTKLSNLKHLDLGYNRFEGQSQLPHFFQNMTSLQFLDLAYSPLSLASNFANLLNMFPSLFELHLSYCNQNETHLTHILHNFTTNSNIQHLDLSRNKLTGPIPETLRKLISLQVLDLSRNELTGAIPVSIGQLSKLRSLDVSDNSLEGVVFESHFANLSMLKYLNAASNSKLTFNVSHEWLPPFQLARIYLRSCKIVNGFPQWLRNQRRLNALDMSNTTISGPLPIWLQKMPIISILDLSNNHLSGPLTNLPTRDAIIDDDSEYYRSVLFLQNNTFSESIPRSLCKIEKLLALDLSRNKLTGKIPDCFKNLQDLGWLNLNSNGLSGVIPSFIGNMSELKVLNLNNNNFRGELPAELWNLSLLFILDVGDNAFSGIIPEWIGEKMKFMLIFRLHNNNFSGGIPKSLCENLKLHILDVAHNNLTGTIPRCLGELKGMINHPNIMSFGYNVEEGVTQVMKGNALEYTTTWSLVTNMDLSSNKLVGEIPIELTALNELVGLNLSNNHLIGRIPDNIGNMKALNSLDFSGNELSGNIPPSIAALTFLSYLNLSNNNLSGRIPTGNQLRTLIDPSIYAGNKGLCGVPLPNDCSNHEDPTTTAKNKHEATDETEVWFYADILCGFVTGFWGIIIVLVLKKQWRNKFFMFAEETIDKIHVSVMVRVTKMKRGREAI